MKHSRLKFASEPPQSLIKKELELRHDEQIREQLAIELEATKLCEKQTQALAVQTLTSQSVNIFIQFKERIKKMRTQMNRLRIKISPEDYEELIKIAEKLNIVDVPEVRQYRKEYNSHHLAFNMVLDLLPSQKFYFPAIRVIAYEEALEYLQKLEAILQRSFQLQIKEILELPKQVAADFNDLRESIAKLQTQKKESDIIYYNQLLKVLKGEDFKNISEPIAQLLTQQRESDIKYDKQLFKVFESMNCIIKIILEAKLEAKLFTKTTSVFEHDEEEISSQFDKILDLSQVPGNEIVDFEDAQSSDFTPRKRISEPEDVIPKKISKNSEQTKSVSEHYEEEMESESNEALNISQVSENGIVLCSQAANFTIFRFL